MSGSRWSRSAQLALIDSVVFFAAAILISSIIMFDFSVPDESEAMDLADPAGLLSVFLSASLGRAVTLPGTPPVVLRETDSVGDCLLAEAVALSNGAEPYRFLELNEVFIDLLESATGPCVAPHLRVCAPNEWQSPLVILPDEPDVKSEARACSMDIAADGHEFMICIVLVHSSADQIFA